MFDFIRTDKGWLVFWGPRPRTEEQCEAVGVEELVTVAEADEEAEAPILVTAEAEALGPMAV
jgi:hypothetical protein